MLETGFVTLDRLLKRLHKNKPELLMVLDRERRGPQGMIRLRYRCVFQRRWGPEIYAGKVRTPRFRSKPTLHRHGSGEGIVETHDVPVVYVPDANYPEAHLSYRLIIRDQCSGIVRDTENGALSFGVHFNGVFQENTTPNRGAQLEALAMA
jgi:hypothetical protein